MLFVTCFSRIRGAAILAVFSIGCCTIPNPGIAQVLNVAVLQPKIATPDIPYAYVVLLRTQLTSAISSSNSFQALSRSDLDALSEEFNFQQNGPVKPEETRQMGAMLGAEVVCVSELTRANEAIVLTATMIELATAKVLATEVSAVVDDINAVDAGSRSLASRLVSLTKTGKATDDEMVDPGNTTQLEQWRSSFKEDTAQIARNSPLSKPSILLMNGQVIEARVLGQSTFEVRYVELGKNRRSKERAEPTENVFSVTDSLGRERVWYFQDTIFGNELSVQEMRWFIKGEQDARSGYKPRIATWGGFLVGAGASIALNLEVNALFIPPVYAAAMALPRVHVTRGSLTDPYLEGEPNYAYGYAKVGRSKRVIRSLISTAAGIAVGVGVRQFIINPNLEGYN